MNYDIISGTESAYVHSHHPEDRKKIPVYSGVLKYFPDAIKEVAKCSLAGTIDTDGIRHSAKVAWRALANLQKEIEKDGL